MYLTDFREYSLKDVITQFEPGLFKKVTGLAVNDFELLVSLGLFNDELMNDAVYNFKRYEDSSLEYAGIKMHSDDEDIGLFSTVISRDDYEQMAKQQGSSMEIPIADSAQAKVPSKVTTFRKKKETGVSGKVQKPTRPFIVGHEVANMVAESQFKYGKENAAEIPEINVGDRIRHNKFGEGTIISVEDTMFTVQFKEGTKTLGTQVVFSNKIVTLI